jgi:hypothetical protein
MYRIAVLLFLFELVASTAAWLHGDYVLKRQRSMIITSGSSNLPPADSDNSPISLSSLMEMDVVVCTLSHVSSQRFLAAVQETGTLAPLSVWKDEPVYGSSLEFVVDDSDPVPDEIEDAVIVAVVPEHLLSYGSRQVGGGKGPGNPHGEESERLYYVDELFVKEQGVDLLIKPHLEILW